MTEVAELRPPDLENLEDRYQAYVAELEADETNSAPPVDPDGFFARGHLSHSSIGTQLACLRRFQHAYVEGIELIARPKPLSMGDAFAHGVDVGSPTEGADRLDRATFSQDEYDDLLKDKAIVAGAVSLYLQRWGAKDGAAREVPYRIRIRSPYTGAWSRTFDLTGRADGVTDHGGYIEMLEDKFVGRVDSVTVKKVALDQQVSLGAYSLWRIYGKPVRVVKYRWIKKPSIRQKQTETAADFCERVIADYLMRPDFYAVEESAFRSEADMLEIEQELWEWAEQRRQAAHRGFYPRNTASCSDYGGCAFIPLCAGDADAPSLYRKRDSNEHLVAGHMAALDAVEKLT